MNGLKLALLLAALSQLGACAVMSKKECLNANWKRVGYNVGADGDRAYQEAFLARETACAKHGAVADQKQFVAGHREGIDYFCGLFSAVELGKRGRYSVIDKQTCPANDYPGFRENFLVGYKLYNLNQDVYQVESHVSSLRSQQNQYKRRIREINRAIKDEELTPEQCSTYESERARLRSYISEISHDISSYDSELYDVRSRARRYREYLDQEYLDPLLNDTKE